jgi:MobA/MobL family
MAQYRFSVRNPISRGKGQSAVAKAAYNAREAIRDERTGQMKDFSRNKDEVLFSGIFVDPKRNAPAWAQQRAELWNAASAAEKRKDAREAQEIILNLPHELTDQQRRYMLTDFVREQITRSTGRVADVNIHTAPKHGDDRNIHAHILMSVRAIGQDGFGERLPEVTPEQIAQWKEKWAERGAKELRKAGFEIEADRWAVGHHTLERQRQAALERGDLAYAETLNREPTKHLGPQVAAMQRKGVETERGNIYRDTVEHNADLAALKRELTQIEKLIAAEQTRPEPSPWEKHEAHLAALAAAEGLHKDFGRGAHEAAERISAPEDLNNTAARIWEACQRSDNARSFLAALKDSGLLVARATKEEARVSEIDNAIAEREGKYRPVYREGEILIVNELANVYRLSPHTASEAWRDIRKFMETLDPKAALSIEATKQIMQDRAEAFDLERQAFRDLNAVGVLKGEGLSTRQLEWAAGKVDRDVTDILSGAGVAANLTKNTVSRGVAAVGKPLEKLAELAAAAIEFLGNMFGATALTPERIQAAVDAQEKAAAEADLDLARFKADKDYRRMIEAREEQKLEQERSRYYEQQQERDRQR